MTILNPDGSKFLPVGSLTQFDPESPDHCLFNQWDAESIEIGGTPLFYHEVFINVSTLDPIYREDRGKIYSTHPVQLFGLYEPIPSQNYQNMFGIDGIDEMEFEFNYQAVLAAIGHPPKVGSRIYSPHLRENWKITQRSLEEHKLWGAIRLKVFCGRFQESSTTGEGRVTQKEPDFRIDDIGK